MIPSPSSLQVPVRPVVGERCGRRQPGESSDWPAGLTWCGGGGWQVHRDAPRVGVPLTEYADDVGITGRPKQYVLTNAAFLCKTADLLVVERATVADSVSWTTSLFSQCPCVFFFFHDSFINTFMYLVRNAIGRGAWGCAGGSKQPR